MPTEEFAANGPRVRLRSMHDQDVPFIERWYGEAAAAAHGLRESDALRLHNPTRQIKAAGAARSGGLLVIRRVGEDEPIGLLDYRFGVAEEGWVTVGCLALAVGARRWGLGVDAVRLFEEEAVRRWGVRGFRANVDVRHGLGLYFWLRLGYRPLGVTVDSRGNEVLHVARETDLP